MDSSWTNELIRYLPNTMVVLRTDTACFNQAVDIFNHAVTSPAHAVVRVTSASDVSTVVLFAKSHGLSISVKAGGHNTAGWAVHGDIVIDLVSLNHVDLHIPDESTGKITLGSLRFASQKGKGKKRGETEAFGVEVVGTSESSTGRSNGMNKKGAEASRKSSLEGNLINISSEGQNQPLSLSRSGSGSSGSSSNPSNGKGGFNEDTPPSDTTGPTTSSATAASSNGKGKARGELNGLPVMNGNGYGMNEEMLSEGTRNWLAEQSNRPQVPSWATSYQPRRNFPGPNGVISPPIPSMSNAGISSSGFNFNPAAMASSSFSSTTATPNPTSVLSSSGFVFNPAALASRSTLAASIVAPFSIPSSNSPISPLSSSSTTSIAFNSTSNTSPSYALASTTIPPSIPFATLPSISSFSSSNVPITSTSSSSSTPSSVAGSSSGISNSNSTTTASSSSSLPSPPHALVTICAGAKSHEIDAVTGTMNYYCPQAAYPVGCAIFASGGFGFMSRLNGLSMDNVVEVEMVLADGRIVYLHPPSEDTPSSSSSTTSVESDDEIEQRDLWWAFRGAGTALGIVTRLRAKAFKVGLVFSGNLIYPFNVTTTPSLVKYWRDCCQNAPRELYCNLILTAGPNPSSHVVVIQICYLGARGEGEKFLQTLMSWEGERCLLKDVETRTFMEQQDSVKQVLGVQSGSRWCIRANLANTLPDDAIDQTIAAFVNIPEKSAWLFEIAGGAIADVKPDSSCFPSSHRSAPFQVAAIHQWTSEAQDKLWLHAAKDWIDNVIGPQSPGGSFPCFLETREGVESVRKVFGKENWERLIAIKEKLDPEYFFKHTFFPGKEEIREVVGTA